jgi:hypothetical protein
MRAVELVVEDLDVNRVGAGRPPLLRHGAAPLSVRRVGDPE